MTRIAILFSFLFAACDVGVVGMGPGSGSNPGGPDGGGGGGDAAAAACANRATPITAHIHAAGATTNAGLGCLNAGCHLQGGAGPQFQFAGTIYKIDGTTANTGVTINIISSGGTKLTPPAISDDAGNFYIYAGTLPMAFPATVSASVCPAADAPMTDQVQSNGGGNCNNCHVGGGTAPPISIADQ